MNNYINSFQNFKTCKAAIVEYFQPQHCHGFLYATIIGIIIIIMIAYLYFYKRKK